MARHPDAQLGALLESNFSHLAAPGQECGLSVTGESETVKFLIWKGRCARQVPAIRRRDRPLCDTRRPKAPAKSRPLGLQEWGMGRETEILPLVDLYFTYIGPIPKMAGTDLSRD